MIRATAARFNIAVLLLAALVLTAPRAQSQTTTGKIADSPANPAVSDAKPETPAARSNTASDPVAAELDTLRQQFEAMKTRHGRDADANTTA